jgi:PAS domain-containing protein
MPLRFDESETVVPAGGHDYVGVSADELLALCSRFGRIGTWTIDIDNSHYEVSPTVYEIFGMEFTQTRASLLAFRERIHPDDLVLVGEALSTASERKCSFSLIYRIRNDGCYRFIRSIGAYRPVEGTSGELYGVTYELTDQVRELVFGP